MQGECGGHMHDTSPLILRYWWRMTRVISISGICHQHPHQTGGWLHITHSSHYLESRVSIIKLDPDDAGLTRTKIEEGELGEAEVWRRGTRWHQDKERWMMVVATGDKHWQEGLRPGERVSYSPRSALKQTPHPIPLFLNIDHSHACNFSLQLLYCWLGQANFLCNFSLSALEAPELSGSDLWM